MRNAFGKTVYGNVGVDISELAGKIAKEMHEAGERAKLEERKRAETHQYAVQEEIYVIGRKIPGGYTLETVQPIMHLGIVSGRGATLEIAKCELRMNLARLLRQKRAAKTWEDARERAAKLNLYVADVLGEEKIQVGAGD